MNDLMCRVQAALERDLHPRMRGNVLGEGDYQRVHAIIEAEIAKHVQRKVSAEVERRTRGLDEERAEFHKREAFLQSELRKLEEELAIYSAERKRAEEKRARIVAAQKLAEERNERQRAEKFAAERREMLAEQSSQTHAQEAMRALKEAKLREAEEEAAREEAEKRRWKLLRTKVYRDTRGWKDQNGSPIDDATYAEIMELRNANGG